MLCCVVGCAGLCVSCGGRRAVLCGGRRAVLLCGGRRAVLLCAGRRAVLLCVCLFCPLVFAAYSASVF